MKKVRFVFITLVSTLFLLLLGSVFLSLTYKKDITLPSTVLGQHIIVNGVKLRYHQQGKGPDILYLHGSIGNLEDFETVQPHLKHYRVTTIDRIGHGYSENNPEGANIEQNALYIQALIKKLNLKNVIVAGHSYGGSIALKMAINNASQVKGYLLLAPAAYPGHKTRYIEHIFAKPVIGLGLLRIFSPVIAEDMLGEGLKQAVAPDLDRLPRNFITDRIKLWNNPGTLFARTQQTVSFNEEFKVMQSSYKNINKPVVIILGEKDSFNLIKQDSRRLVKEIPGAKLVILPNGGHYIHYHAPAKVAAIVHMMNK